MSREAHCVCQALCQSYRKRYRKILRKVRPVYIAAPKLDTKIQSSKYFYTFLYKILNNNFFALLCPIYLLAGRLIPVGFI